MGFVAQLLDLQDLLKISKQGLRKELDRLVKENKDIAKAVQSLQASARNRDHALVEVIKRNPAAHAALIESLLHRRKR